MRTLLTCAAFVAVLLLHGCDERRACADIKEVHVCTGDGYRSKCRVTLQDGSRMTTYTLVAPGDRVCWPVRE